MQWVLVIASLASADAVVRKEADKAYKYGPSHCVSLSRSDGGSCVIETNCPSADIQNFTFDFICVDGVGTKVQHSFGEGNFDEQETFDTGVACAECKPTEGGVLVSTGSEEGKKKEAKEEKEAANVPPKDAAFYGPGGCVATYRSGSGTCIMQTRCTGKDTTEYNFGLSCVDGEGSTTRHLFGVNSFDPEETFDTLVECKLCLGLDGDDALKNVTALAKDVTELQSQMKDIQADVKSIMKELNLEKEKKEEAPAEDAPADGDDAPAEDAPADAEGDAEPAADDAASDDGADADAAEGFLHRKVSHHKKAKKARKKHAHVRRHRHTKPKRHVELDDDDDDESVDSELSDADLSLD